MNIKEEVFFLCGRGNYPLGKEILEKLTELLGQLCDFYHTNFNKFPEGELDNRIPEFAKILGKIVVYFQSITSAELAAETIDTCWACKHQYGASKIIAVISFMYNRRQDPKMEIGPEDEPGKKAKPDEIQRLRMYISKLAWSGVTDLIVVTPHSGAMAEYAKEFGINFYEIDPSSLFVEKIYTFVPEEEIDLVTVYSPDLGSIKRAVKLAKILNCPIIFNIKNRLIYNETSIATIEEEELKKLTNELRQKYNFPEIHYVTSERVEGKIVVMIEDEVASGGTANSTAQLIRKNKAKNILFFATHAVFTWGWRNKLFQDNPFSKIIITNSIHRDYEKKTGGGIVDVSIASPIASTLFKLLK